MGFPGGSAVRNRAECKNHRRCMFDPWVRKIPWRRAGQVTQVLLPREYHGQRSLVGYSPQAHKESDVTEVTQHTHACPQTVIKVHSWVCVVGIRSLLSEASQDRALRSFVLSTGIIYLGVILKWKYFLPDPTLILIFPEKTQKLQPLPQTIVLLLVCICSTRV